MLQYKVGLMKVQYRPIDYRYHDNYFGWWFWCECFQL